MTTNLTSTHTRLTDPEELELYKIVLVERGYLHPQTYIKDMIEYYEMKGWPSSDKAALMRYWMTGAERMHHVMPDLNEEERNYMKCFFENCDQPCFHRFCELFCGMHLLPDAAIFVFDVNVVEKIGYWIEQQALGKIMAVYPIELRIRTLEYDNTHPCPRPCPRPAANASTASPAAKASTASPAA